MTNERPRRQNSCIRIAIALLVLLVIPSLTWATCGASDVCNDVTNSIYVVIDIDDATITWSTDAEDSTVDFYVIRRYDCATPSTCSVYVATVSAIGSCDTNEDYSYEDSPTTPVSAWTYTVEVWSTGNVRACAVDVIPE